MIRGIVSFLLVLFFKSILSIDPNLLCVDRSQCIARVRELVQKISQRAESLNHYMSVATALELESRLLMIQQRNDRDLHLVDCYLMQLEAYLYGSYKSCNLLKTDKNHYLKSQYFIDIDEIQ